MDTKKIQALISLLDDPDVEIFSTVEGELLKEQVEIVPELEKAWEVSADDVFQKRVENIIHSIQFENLKKEIREWKRSIDPDLLFAAYLVAKYQYPELSFSEISDGINAIRKDIWLELSGPLTSLENIRIVNYILYDKYKFSRNSKELLSPTNNFINDVLRTKKGNPVSLSIIYSAVCQSLGMPVYGVNLPKNFILVYLDEEMTNVAKEGCTSPLCSALFYINPINNGAIIGKKEIEVFLKQQKLTFLDNYFTPCSNQDIVKRLLNNLRFSYESRGEDEKKKEVMELIMLIDEDKDQLV
jgi:regulator of sirC expression with transglutaminase-like and TPR domain